MKYLPPPSFWACPRLTPVGPISVSAESSQSATTQVFSASIERVSRTVRGCYSPVPGPGPLSVCPHLSQPLLQEFSKGALDPSPLDHEVLHLKTKSSSLLNPSYLHSTRYRANAHLATCGLLHPAGLKGEQSSDAFELITHSLSSTEVACFG